MLIEYTEMVYMRSMIGEVYLIHLIMYIVLFFYSNLIFNGELDLSRNKYLISTENIHFMPRGWLILTMTIMIAHINYTALYCFKVTRHLFLKNRKMLCLLNILACNLANKPSFQNLTKIVY